MSVPTFNDLTFYSDPKAATARFQRLATLFRDTYGEQLLYFARSPGRVNLIGDHIDYNLFSCLPMAIDFDVVEAVRPNDTNKIELINTDPQFAPALFELPADGPVVIDDAKFGWELYFKCALIVSYNYLREKKGITHLKGMQVAVDGTVPSGGGLLSLAAICVALTLAILKANGVEEVLKEDLTRITVVSEHYIGLNNGGLDQCASVYGEADMCLLVQFRPELKGTPFKFPELPDGEELKFIISNSLVESPKKLTAPVNYNLRVVEMGVALDLLAKKFDLLLTQDSNINLATLRGFMEGYFPTIKGDEPWDGHDNKKAAAWLQELTDAVEEWFTAEQKVGFTTAEAAEALGLSVDEFTQKYLTKMEVRYEKLKLYQRTKHVFAELLRVLKCLQLLETVDDGEVFLKEFGAVMNDSQALIRDLNGLSHANCDRICDIALANGSYGTRVTGAGFGGSLVLVTTAKKLPQLLQALTEEYYRQEFPNITEAELANALVDTRAASGSSVVAATVV